ncbi:MAG: hypothetical protein AABZ30_05000 [Myxococcota bacterium]
MPILDDDAMLDAIRYEGRGVPAASYLQRRFGLPYTHAARLRAMIEAQRFLSDDTPGEEIAVEQELVVEQEIVVEIEAELPPPR